MENYFHAPGLFVVREGMLMAEFQVTVMNHECTKSFLVSCTAFLCEALQPVYVWHDGFMG